MNTLNYFFFKLFNILFLYFYLTGIKIYKKTKEVHKISYCTSICFKLFELNCFLKFDRNEKEQHIIHDYWNCRHEYEIIFGQKYLGYHPCRPTPRKTKETKEADYYDFWKMNNLGLTKRPAWNSVF